MSGREDEAAADPRALKVIPSGIGYPGQFSIENAEIPLDDFDREYVNFSGYYGAHGPHVFKAAPCLLEALEEAKEELAYFVEFARQQCEFTGDIEAGYSAIRKCLAAIARARGEV